VIYAAFDKARDKKVAIKMEKPDKSRSVLVSEYQLLTKLKGVAGVIQVVDFVS
jgi:predicted Ser/Thr protein kinase